ncbi:hypothetical protein OIU76_008402 [Salix suchowensis]|nr:hypothetical protein OIU76_008402 [Salix suchowensis]
MEHFLRRGSVLLKLEAVHMLQFVKISALTLALLRSFLTCSKQTYFFVNLVEIIWLPTFSRELADYIIYIIDVSAGDKIPRKGGPGITQADLLVINKTDLAQAVGADLAVMERDALRMRDGGPFVFAQVKHGLGIEEIVNHILQGWEVATGKKRQ